MAAAMKRDKTNMNRFQFKNDFKDKSNGKVSILLLEDKTFNELLKKAQTSCVQTFACDSRYLNNGYTF